MADNKKIYTIQINGIDQSIKQVDALSDALQFLDKKIKELESRSVSITSSNSGQFGRNVGNYKSAFDEMKKVTVQVGNTAREFKSVMDASRQLTQELKAMSIAEKEDTEEYKELAEAVHNFEIATKRAESAVNDLKASSKGMDDILDTFESLGYLASTTQGLSALFGFDNSSIERSIQKLVALQNVLQGIEKLRLKIKAGDAGIIGDLFKGGNQAVDSFVAKITGAKIGINGLTKGSKAATLAVRGLSTALKGIGIGFVIEGITMLISVLDRYTNETSKAEQANRSLTMSLNTLNKEYEKKMDLLSASYMRQEISDAQYLANAFRLQAQNIRETTAALQDMSAIMNSMDWTSYLNPDTYLHMQGTGYTGSRLSGTENKTASSPLNGLGDYDYSKMFKDIDKAEEEFKKLQDSIRKGNDYLDEYGNGIIDWLGSLVITVDDTKDAMIGVGNAIASDINNRLMDSMGKLKDAMADAAEGVEGADERVKKYKEEVRSLYQEMNNSEAYKSFLANMDKYIPDEAVREKLKNILDGFQDFYNSMDENSEKWVHYWNQVRIDAMKDGNAKINAQIEENRRHEIAEHGDTQEHINAINAKYNRQRLEQQDKYNEQAKNKAKQHAREIEAVEKELNQLRIQNMAEGLAKQLAQLEEERRQKLAKAKQDGIKVNELTVEINKLYDKKILDAKKEWAYNIEQVYINMWNKIYQINHQNAQMDFENQLKQIQSNYAKLQDMAAKNSNGVNADYSDKGVVVTKTPESKKKAGSSKAEDYDYEVLIEKDEAYTQRLRQEYATRTEDRKRYYQEIEQLTIQQLDDEYAVESQKAIENMNNELRTLQNGYKAQDHELETHLKKGEITREQYNEAVERLEKERAENEAQIVLKYQTEREQREKQHNQKIKEAKEQTNEAILNNYRQVMDKLNSVDSSEVVRNGIGFMNITATRRRNKELIDMYKQLSDDIANEMKTLEQRLSTEDLTKEQREQIEALINEYRKLQATIGQTMTNIQANSNAATQAFISECNMYFQEFAQTLQTVLQAVWDAQDQAYEKEMEKLDKTIDAAREKYQEMDELANEHKNNMESLENDIKNAQGDARDHLLARYNAEMEAQRAALREKKKAEKEEEKLQQKKEKKEIEQKKREKKRNLVTAAINTAMAISMAAVNSWPVPAIPMMAAAAVAGAAQIAAIASQNYAHGGQLDGGVAQGNRHRDGGIKVLGGHAEIEGGEFITNRLTTSKNIDLLEYINSKKKRININDLIEFYGGDSPVKKNIQNVRTRFADGGVIPTLTTVDTNDRLLTVIEDYSNRPVQVAVVDIIDRTEQVNNVKVMAGLDV